MRVIGGKFKGKKLIEPKDKETRPLKDLTKESIFNIINHSNKFSIDLKKAQVGDEMTLEITEDTAKMADKIDELVVTINEVIAFIKEQNALDESSDTSQTLGGDITLQTLESKIRSTIFKTVHTYC